MLSVFLHIKGSELPSRLIPGLPTTFGVHSTREILVSESVSSAVLATLRIKRCRGAGSAHHPKTKIVRECRRNIARTGGYGTRGSLTSIGFLTRGTGMFPRSAFLSFATFLFLLRFLLLQR